MKNYLSKKTAGFYMTVIAAVFALIGLVFYAGYRGMQTTAVVLVLCAVGFEILLTALSAKLGNKRFLDLAASVCAILVAAGIMVSLPNQIDGFGFLVAGLYTFDDVKNGVFFLIPAAVSLILYIAASFMRLGKD